jgi:hypothetical protein
MTVVQTKTDSFGHRSIYLTSNRIVVIPAARARAQTFDASEATGTVASSATTA